MMAKSENGVIELIKQDEWMMDVLKAAQQLNLPDWWICAGFVRSKIWDTLHKFKDRTAMADVDVIYFDPENIDELEEKQLEKRLSVIMPSIPWSVKNEARMHIPNHIPHYSSSVDAISKFPETATALGVKLDEQGNVILAAPFGIKDLLSLVVKPTPYFMENEDLAFVYKKRILKKNWKATWPKIKVQQTKSY
ncbi:nucleotidyltransferase family protein [Alkalihalophilus lindianensis]|uniref:Nucleotidyltransferase family protein n=1 Tax=Alkalihalophilus lindianensis TaxID=1630542 RepID=A0ABU3X4I6_9BACI|nr:nucleotidyltransferase family protein [Alkalihalophilus lindianensis]MDV2682807.1 nucleotidyltransferase family protein [Alkalihalophilus lindianensis]